MKQACEHRRLIPSFPLREGGNFLSIYPLPQDQEASGQGLGVTAEQHSAMGRTGNWGQECREKSRPFVLEKTLRVSHGLNIYGCSLFFPSRVFQGILAVVWLGWAGRRSRVLPCFSAASVLQGSANGQSVLYSCTLPLPFLLFLMGGNRRENNQYHV